MQPKAAAAALALGFALAATPSLACSPETPCGVDDFTWPIQEDLPPPGVFELVKQRRDGGVSLAGFYNEPFPTPDLEPIYGDATPDGPHVIYSPWGHLRNRGAHDRRRFHAARIHDHIRRF